MRIRGELPIETREVEIHPVTAWGHLRIALLGRVGIRGDWFMRADLKPKWFYRWDEHPHGSDICEAVCEGTTEQLQVYEAVRALEKLTGIDNHAKWKELKKPKNSSSS